MSAFINAANAYISATYVTTATQPLTIMCRFNLPSIVVRYRDIISLDPNITLQTFTDGITLNFGTGNSDNLGPLLAINTWYHAAYVCVPTSTTSRQIYGYLNGDLVVNVTDTASTFAATTRLVVGNNRVSTNAGLQGQIRDVRVWNRALTATNILEEKNSVVPFNDEGLISFLPLDTSLVRDQGSSRFVWTNTAGVTLQHGGMRGSYPSRNPRTLRF
jgi:hypothetical protein